MASTTIPVQESGTLDGRYSMLATPQRRARTGCVDLETIELGCNGEAEAPPVATNRSSWTNIPSGHVARILVLVLWILTRTICLLITLTIKFLSLVFVALDRVIRMLWTSREREDVFVHAAANVTAPRVTSTLRLSSAVGNQAE